MAARASAAAVITDPFDTYVNGDVAGNGGWTAGGAQFQVEGTDTANGLKAVHATFSTGTILSGTGTEVSDGQQTIYIKPETGSSYNRIYFRHSAGDTPVFEIRITNNTGLVQLKDGTNAVIDIGNLTNDVWGYIQINWESATHTYKMNINGGAWSSSYTWRSTDNPDYVQIELNDGDFYMDEWAENVFTPTTPPTATSEVSISDLFQKITATPDTDAVFYLNKSISYGDILVCVFLTIFLVWGVIVGLWKLVFPFNFKK